MTSLRPQLRFARQAYRAARYPGDLGAELLPKQSLRQSLSTSIHRRRWMVFGGVGASAAAAAFIVSMLLSPLSNLPRHAPGDGAQRELANSLPSSPAGLPLPRFH